MTMDGHGAGRRSHRGVLDACRQLDVNEWRRVGVFAGWQVGSCVWSDEDGRQVASIGYRSSHYEVELMYTVDASGEGARDLRYRVPIMWTSCNFGGERPWFICPNTCCGRKATKLYLHGGYFVCRHCTGLGYRSQREDAWSQLVRRAQKAWAKAGGGLNLIEPFPLKPKGMHRRTYQRLRREEQACFDGLLRAFPEGV